MKKLITILIIVTIALQTQAQWNYISSPFTGSVRGLYFQDANTGYAVGGDNATTGYIAKTTDGAITWSSMSISGTTLLRSVSFLDANTGYTCGQGGTVYKTTDAGSTWNNIYTNAAQYFRAVSFVSSQVGFLGGAAGTILKTSDGGATWTTTNLGETTSDIIQLKMNDANTGYAVASSSVFASGYVFKTTDGGSTWTQVHSDASIGFLALAVVNASTAYVGGNNQTILKTTDGGSTWNTVYTGTAGTSFRSAAGATDDKIYLADDGTGNVSNGSIVNTDDAGDNWTATSFTGIVWLNITFPTSTVGFAGNTIGGIYKFGESTTCSVNAPTDLLADVLTANKVVLSWTPPTGAVKYSIQYQTPDGVWKITSKQNAHKLTDLSPSTKYVWQVKAYCGSPIGGQSSWSAKSSFITPALKVENSEIASSFEVYPNPVSSTATISFTLDQDSKVTADLFTIDGKKVLSIADQQFSSGANEITMNRGSLSAGTYILQLKTNDDLLTRKIDLQ